MADNPFRDATLVLIGHGSTLNPDSAAPTYQHADAIRHKNVFASVLEAFWKQEPAICGVLRGAFTPKVFIVPLFISEGYFTEEVIPRELGFCEKGQKEFPRVKKCGDQTLYYCHPVGTHPSMTDVLLSRAREVVEKHPGDGPTPPPMSEQTLFLAGHGTGNNENSRKIIEHQVEVIRGRGLYADVQAAFMEEEPKIERCYEAAKTENIVMVPFFISDGLHSYEDIPAMLGEPVEEVQRRFKAGIPTWTNPTTMQGKRVWYSSSIGTEPLMADVVLERVNEASVWSAPE